MRVIMCALTLLVAGQLSAHAQEAGLIEPQAGTWKTWVISSATEFRVPRPPDRIATEKELRQLAQIAGARRIFPEVGRRSGPLAADRGRQLPKRCRGGHGTRQAGRRTRDRARQVGRN